MIDIIAAAAYCLVGGGFARYYSSFFSYKKRNISRITAGQHAGKTYIGVGDPYRYRAEVYEAWRRGNLESDYEWHKYTPIAVISGLTAFLFWPLFAITRMVWLTSKVTIKTTRKVFKTFDSIAPSFMVPEIEKVARRELREKNIELLEKELLND
jgi:hypothetical protein